MEFLSHAICCKFCCVQLPPCSEMKYDTAAVVSRRGSPAARPGIRKDEMHYLFEGPAWSAGNFQVATLSTSWRHKDDPEMADVLK